MATIDKFTAVLIWLWNKSNREEFRAIFEQGDHYWNKYSEDFCMDGGRFWVYLEIEERKALLKRAVECYSETYNIVEV